MDGARFDVWLHAMTRVADESPAHALSRVFRLPPTVADQLVAALPRIVARDATEAQAQRVVATLQSIGGTAAAVVRPLRPLPMVRIGIPVDIENAEHAAPTVRAQAAQEANDPQQEVTHDLPPPSTEPQAVLPPSVEHPLMPSTADGPWVVTHTLADWHEAAAHAALAVETERVLPQPLALPPSTPPPAPSPKLRRPRERTPELRRPTQSARESFPSDPARRSGDPLTSLAKLWHQTQHESLQSAVRSHPVAGFVLVLGATTGVCVLLYAVF